MYSQHVCHEYICSLLSLEFTIEEPPEYVMGGKRKCLEAYLQQRHHLYPYIILVEGLLVSEA